MVTIKNSFPIIRFSKNLEKDIRNWWEANNHLSYGFDFGNRCPSNIKRRIKGKKFPEIKNYLRNAIKKCYKYYPNWKEKNEKNILGMLKKIIKRLEKIHGKKFPVKCVDIFYTSFPRCSYGGGKEKFWIQINTSDEKYSLKILIHELMHLFFHKYYWQICKKQGLTEEETHDIKEAFTVIINEEFKDMYINDRGYDEHKQIRKYILQQWKKTKNFKKVLNLAIVYYKK